MRKWSRNLRNTNFSPISSGTKKQDSGAGSEDKSAVSKWAFSIQEESVDDFDLMNMSLADENQPFSRFKTLTATELPSNRQVKPSGFQIHSVVDSSVVENIDAFPNIEYSSVLEADRVEVCVLWKLLFSFFVNSKFKKRLRKDDDLILIVEAVEKTALFCLKYGFEVFNNLVYEKEGFFIGNYSSESLRDKYIGREGKLAREIDITYMEYNEQMAMFEQKAPKKSLNRFIDGINRKTFFTRLEKQNNAPLYLNNVNSQKQEKKQHWGTYPFRSILGGSSSKRVKKQTFADVNLLEMQIELFLIQVSAIPNTPNTSKEKIRGRIIKKARSLAKFSRDYGMGALVTRLVILYGSFFHDVLELSEEQVNAFLKDVYAQETFPLTKVSIRMKTKKVLTSFKELLRDKREKPIEFGVQVMAPRVSLDD
eukprot:augustus_masked-scaffold_1-processed-gene-5.54-mRNA-1 protein AED:0.10 eAED:1.00 QI:0/-1/0/1/-1/1/1/0/422